MEQVKSLLDSAKQKTPRKAYFKWEIKDPVAFDKFMFENLIDLVDENYEMREEIKEFLASLYAYFQGKEGKLDPTKGILLVGPIGCGKTTLIKLVARIMATRGKIIKPVSCPSLHLEYVKNPEYFYNYWLYFDDIGRETQKVKWYGTEIFPMEEILTQRYMKEPIKYTCGTSNIPLRQMPYDGYVVDRMIEMFNIVTIRGDSFRPSKIRKLND